MTVPRSVQPGGLDGSTLGPRKVGFVAALFGIMGASTLMGFVLGVLAPYLIADLGITELAVGLISSLVYLAGSVAAPSLGVLVDNFGPRRVALSLVGAVASAHLVFAVSPNVLFIGLAALIAGTAMGVANPATNRLVVDQLPPGSRGAAMGWKQAGVPAGAFLVGVAVPGSAELLGWRPTVVVLAALLAVIALVAAVVLPSDRVPTVDEERTDAVPFDRRTLSRTLRWLNIYAALLGGAGGATAAYLVLYATTLGMPPAVAGLTSAVSGATGIAARVVLAKVAERQGRPDGWLVGVAAMSLVGGVSVLSAVGVGNWSVWVGAIFFGLGLLAWQAVAMVALVDVVPDYAVGSASGLVMRAFYAGFVLGPVTFGLLVDQAGYSPAWFGLVLACAGGVGAGIMWMRRTRAVLEAPR